MVSNKEEGKPMARRRLLLLLKPLDIHPPRHSHAFARITNPKILGHMDNRVQVHKEAINFCKDVLQRKLVDFQTLFHNDLSHPIQNVDLVVTVGGDGTLLQTSHFMDDSIPVLGVCSDPTQDEEVEMFRDEFDATRSTGHLCAATVKNFEQVLDGILDKRAAPYEVSRISIRVNSQLLPTYALNDVLIAHPCPASVSRFSFRLSPSDQSYSPLVNSRSSGLRVSTAAGSTAAMHSAGGSVMPILLKALQYMVREPISSGATDSKLMRGFIYPDRTMEVAWSTADGTIYLDGCHISHPIRYGDIIELSSKAPVLKIFLRPELLRASELAKL